MTMILQCEPRDIRIKIVEHFIDITHQVSELALSSFFHNFITFITV